MQARLEEGRDGGPGDVLLLRRRLDWVQVEQAAAPQPHFAATPDRVELAVVRPVGVERGLEPTGARFGPVVLADPAPGPRVGVVGACELEQVHAREPDVRAVLPSDGAIETTAWTVSPVGHGLSAGLKEPSRLESSVATDAASPPRECPTRATRSMSTLPASGPAASAFQVRHWSRWSRSSQARTACSLPCIARPGPVQEVLVNRDANETAAREMIGEVGIARLALGAHGVVAVHDEDEREWSVAAGHPDAAIERQRLGPEAPVPAPGLVRAAADRGDRAARVDGRRAEQHVCAIRGPLVDAAAVREGGDQVLPARARVLERRR